MYKTIPSLLSACAGLLTATAAASPSPQRPPLGALAGAAAAPRRNARPLASLRRHLRMRRDLHGVWHVQGMGIRMTSHMRPLFNRSEGFSPNGKFLSLARWDRGPGQTQELFAWPV